MLLVLILVGISALILVLVLIRVRDITTGASEGNCAAVARDMHFTNKYLGRDFTVSDIKGCETELVEIERSDYPRDQNATDREMKQLLAEQMRQCWVDWGRGELDLFKDEGVYCHVCSRISFDYGEQQPLPLTNFSGYLQDTTAPEGKSYAEVLAGAVSENTGVDIVNLGAPAYTVDTSKDYLVLFAYEKYKDQETAAQAIFGANGITPTISGAIAGVAVGAGALILGAPVVVPTAITGFGTYFITRANDEFYTISAIYLTPEGPESYDAERCERLAVATQSP